MEIREFAEKVCRTVEGSLGGSYSVELREVRKNNGVLLHGLTIQKKDANVAPTIYLEHFWRAYEEGVTFAEVMDRLMEVYGQDTPSHSVNMDFFRDFEKVKDRICYRLVGIAGNKDLLKDIPYVEFLDLAVCFYYAYSGEALGEGSILIHNSHVQMWQTDVAELMRLAKFNTPRLFPSHCSTMEEVLEEISGRENRERLLHGEMPMKVLTNKSRTQGAVCMIYQGVLEQIAEELSSSLFILPSSVHEVILLAESERDMAKPEELKEMIVQVNSSQVPPEEVLSNSLYRFDRLKKRVEKVL